MVLLWMILLEVLLCAEAENVTEVRGQLGAEVTLTCSSGPSDIYWHMEIYSQLRAFIGRSFLRTPSTYSSPDFGTKFSILGNRLVIKNLTAEDCRLYFCGIRRDGSIQLVDTFRLVSDFSPSPESDHQQQNSSTAEHQLLIVYRSAFLITALILLILVVVFTSLWLKRQNYRDQTGDPPAPTNENAETLQDEELHSNPPCH